MAITAIPEVQLRIERNGLYRVMFKNPNVGLSEDDSDLINGLRVYNAMSRSGTPTAVGDLDVPFDAEAGFLEVTFTPGDLGVFSFSFLHLEPDAVPSPIEEEGTVSSGASFVYGALSTLYGIFSAEDCFSGQAIAVDALFDLNEFASREFERYTDNFFYPRYQSMRIDGRGANEIVLDYAIIQIIEAHLLLPPNIRTSTLIEPSQYLVYNRHMRDRKAYDPAYPDRPDGALEYPGDDTGGTFGQVDRRVPRVSFLWANEMSEGHRHARSGTIWSTPQRGFSTGRQNILLNGFFGFTEEDLSTPGGVTIAVERLAIRRATLIYGDADDVESMLRAHKVTMEKTDVHTIMYEAKDRLVGAYTGENIIDGWIAHYARGLSGGVV